MSRNPYAPGTAEAEEWSAIAAAPSRHGQGFDEVDPDDPAHLEAVNVDLEQAEPAAAAEDGPRSLSGVGVLFGPDCSQYQGKPDWHAVRAAGCVIGGYKVSEGRTFEDPSHEWNRAQTKANGLVPLAYHYLFYSDAYAADPSLWAAQAEWFVRQADPAAIHVLDVEASATAGHHLGVREFVARYRQLLPGHGLGVYANRALWENRSRMPYTPAGLFDFVWHAGVGNGYYTTATGTIQQQWSAQSGLVNSFAAQGYPVVKLWQITDHAKVSGVGGSFCDGNAFMGTLTELKALTGQNGAQDMPLDSTDLTKVRAIVKDEVRSALADPWVNADALVDDPTKQISPLGMVLQSYLRSPGNLLTTKLGSSGPTVGVALQSTASTVARLDTASQDDATLAQITQLLNDKLGSGTGGGLSKQDVIDAVDEVVGQTHFVAEHAPPA
jgi:hypothetical protein